MNKHLINLKLINVIEFSLHYILDIISFEAHVQNIILNNAFLKNSINMRVGL